MKVNKTIKKIVVLGVAAMLVLSVLAGCGKKKEEVVVPTTEEDAGTGERDNVTMEVAKDEQLRSMLYMFDKYTSTGRTGAMEYDYREQVSNRRLLDCLWGQRCCADYSLYPVAQASYNGTTLTVPSESLSWVATNIFHVPSNEVADYQRTSSGYTDGNYVGTITLDENQVEWYYSDFTITKAETDGKYYYIKYKRNHDDPRIDGDVFQQIYFAVMAKEKIDGKEYWTMFTHSANTFVLIVEDPNLVPDVTFDTEKEMITVADGNVVLRAGPSKDYDSVTVLAPGILVYAMGTKGDWTYVRYYDHYGWIFSELLGTR